MEKTLYQVRWDAMIECLQRVEDEERPFNIRFFVRRHACGTVACAAGWMMLDPAIQRLGLKTVTKRGIEKEWEAPSYNNTEGAGAIAEWLGMDGDLKNKVGESFTPWCYGQPFYKITCRDVRERLESLYPAVQAEWERQALETV